MDFGKLANVDDVDFTLPPDHADTERFFKGMTTHATGNDARRNPAEAGGNAPIVRFGCPRWSDRGFHGKIYPPRTKQSGRLAAYAQSFDTIELNTTFYGVREDLVARWREQTPERFTFCPKLPKAISHHRGLLQADLDMERFVRAVSAFGQRLGPCWILLPPGFRPSQAAVLRAFVERWSPVVPLAVEFRHEEWFAPAHAPLLRETFAFLESKNTIAILTDVAGRRDVLHQRVTARTAILRFVGNRLHPSDYDRVEAWAERLADWIARGLESVHVWLHQPEEALNVEVAERFAAALAERGIRARRPVRHDVEIQGTLF